MEFKNDIRSRDTLTGHNILSWHALSGLLKHLIMMIINLVINIPVMNEVWRERRELEQMTPDQIRDIGLDPTDIAVEVQRSFFDIPTERRKAVFVMTHTEFSQSPLLPTKSTFKA